MMIRLVTTQVGPHSGPRHSNRCDDLPFHECVNYVSPFLARLVKAPSVGRKTWHLATLQYHRWATPSTGRADSDYAVDRIA